MKNLYTLFLFLIAFSFKTKAQFSLGYAPSKWATTLSAGSNGMINSSGAPNSIIITGSDGAGGTNVDIDFTITAIASGVWSFNWAYHTNDTDLSPAYDLGGILINGVFTQLTNNSGAIDQGGNYTAAFVTAGTVIGFRIRATDNTMGNATFTISNFSPPGGVLPIKLNSFTAKPEGSKIMLQWSTSEEVNTSYFEIERSTNGIDFNKLTSVTARNQQHYSVTDTQPLKGANYYRLRIADQDGSMSWSNIISVRAGAISGLQLYPNPVHEQLNLQFDSDQDVKETICIYTSAGKMIETKTINLRKGMNNISLSAGNLPKGIYFINLQTRNRIHSFIKK